jgi:hypothetical protein
MLRDHRLLVDILQLVSLVPPLHQIHELLYHKGRANVRRQEGTRTGIVTHSKTRRAEEKEVVRTSIGPGEKVPTDLSKGESRVFLDPVVAPILPPVVPPVVAPVVAPVVTPVLAPVAAPVPLPHLSLKCRRVCRQA